MWQVRSYSGKDDYLLVIETEDKTLAWNTFNAEANKRHSTVVLLLDGKVNAEIRGSGLRKLW